MIRYTTPLLILRIPTKIEDADVFVTIKQNPVIISKKIDYDDISYDGEMTVINVFLSQEQTAKFHANTFASVQVNWITSDGQRDATIKKKIDITDNLLDKEIQYEE
ncbi:MAG: hypothetical protein PUF17_10435 [Lactimicrobium massiliense]|nr:hypothetical protein [Lactimicrobium massiliense]MDD6561362.1 hypothetical protein [Lactimicrobium massiliense]